MAALQVRNFTEGENVIDVHWKCFPSTLHLVFALCCKIYKMNYLVFVMWEDIGGHAKGGYTSRVTASDVRPALQCDGLK